MNHPNIQTSSRLFFVEDADVKAAIVAWCDRVDAVKDAWFAFAKTIGATEWLTMGDGGVCPVAVVFDVPYSGTLPPEWRRFRGGAKEGRLTPAVPRKNAPADLRERWAALPRVYRDDLARELWRDVPNAEQHAFFNGAFRHGYSNFGLPFGAAHEVIAVEVAVLGESDVTVAPRGCREVTRSEFWAAWERIAAEKGAA